VAIPAGIRASVRDRLSQAGIATLHRHQAEAFEEWALGRNVVVTSGTGSGKSLAYAIPAAEACLAEPMARVLLVYPTKALAQDQAAKLESLLPPALRVAVYDGDTPPSRRAAIRKEANVVLTNPDMLHASILPSTTGWAGFLRALRLVAVDEAHTYRGAFGSHVAYVFRRLLRRCAAQRSHPRFVLASATLADPLRHAAALTGLPFVHVGDDASPRGRQTLLSVQTGTDDASPNVTCGRLLAHLAGSGVRTLCFSRSRSAAELVARISQDELEQAGRHRSLVEPYRAGYTPEERRGIERRFFAGELAGLSSTSAMELGVDVGALEAVVVNGYPGSASRFRQQTGRAGRAGREGLAVFVAHADALENWLAADPSRLAGAPPDPTVVNLENPYVAQAQTRCAAFELPPDAAGLAEIGPGAARAAEALVESGEASWSPTRLILHAHSSPAPSVSIRGTGSGRVLLRCAGSPVGEMEAWRAMQEAHEGAVYLHRAETYLVRRLDLASGDAELEKAELPYYTRAIVQSLVVPTVPIEERAATGLHGVLVVTQVRGYRRIALEGQRVLDEHELDLPHHEMGTIGTRTDLSGLAGPEDASAVHALEHAVATVAPVVASLDRSDLASAWSVACPATLSPVVWLYDPVPGGTGASQAAFACWPAIVAQAHALLASCPCPDGCPRCLLTPHCETGNTGLDKAGGLSLLGSLPDASS
jgi:DEAD/DEAH box helicase domain-containing protein